MHKTCFIAINFLNLLFALSASAADWPCYRGDAGRTAYTSEELATPLYKQWEYQLSTPPSPAWPDPIREVNLMEFDNVFHTAVAGGTVFFGSSSDHQIRAIDLATGKLRWRFFTDAPVRFAPEVYDGKVFVASDDGCAYCLAASDGKLIWRFQAGPADERIFGNGQMTARWLLRSGLVVADNIVYFTAGMWPAEHVWAFALHAEDGSVVWKTDIGNSAPQGYLTVHLGNIIMPTGRTGAMTLKRSSGAIGGGNGYGWAAVRDGFVLSGPPPYKANENLPVNGGIPFKPRPQYLSGSAASGTVGCRTGALAPDIVYAAGSSNVMARQLSSKIEIWNSKCGPLFAVAAAGKKVICGGDGEVSLFDASNGNPIWNAKVHGEARGLAVASGHLIVSTTAGKIICFGTQKPAFAGTVLDAAPAPTAVKSKAVQLILSDSGISPGYAFILGANQSDVDLAFGLVAKTGLRVYCADTDAVNVQKAREKLAGQGLYGKHIVVHQIEKGKPLPYPDYFADIIVTRAGAGADPYSTELLRVLRPSGGKAYRVPSGNNSAGSRDMSYFFKPGDGLKTTSLAGGIECATRGDLPGAGVWTHAVANAGKSACSGDERVRWPLKVLWFGEPGPDKAMNRHLRGTAPVSIGGRVFTLGQHEVIAFNAYNGVQLWSRKMPSIQRRVIDILGGNLVADSEAAYIASGDLCLSFDAASGQLNKTFRLPFQPPNKICGGNDTRFDLNDLGTISIQNDQAGLDIILRSKDPAPTNKDRENRPTFGDAWELFFDFRQKENRTGLYGPGVFQAIIIPATAESATATFKNGPWSKSPSLRVEGTRDKDGTTTKVRIALAEISKMIGAKPAGFAFGAILNSSDDGNARKNRTYSFANNASYRLSNFGCYISLTQAGTLKRQDNVASFLPHEDDPSKFAWGILASEGDALIGTTTKWHDTPRTLAQGWDFASEGQDYTGPGIQNVLGSVGLAPDSSNLFVLEKKTGQLRWQYKPAGAIPHKGIAIANGFVYVLDMIPGPTAIEAKKKLSALNLRDGKTVWATENDLADYDQIRVGNGILLACSLRGMTALDALKGTPLWNIQTNQIMHHCSGYLRVPIITKKWVYDEPLAFDLRTGTQRTLTLDGQERPWVWGGKRSGCGTTTGSENLLFYRDGHPAILDVTGKPEQHAFKGIRPGCFINMIAAGGLLIMPEASSGCACGYSFQTTVVMAPATP